MPKIHERFYEMPLLTLILVLLLPQLTPYFVLPVLVLSLTFRNTKGPPVHTIRRLRIIIFGLVAQATLCEKCNF